MIPSYHVLAASKVVIGWRDPRGWTKGVCEVRTRKTIKIGGLCGKSAEGEEREVV